MSQPMDRLKKASFIDANGNSVPSSVLDGKYVGVYHSASWCMPCRKFTPKLVDAYEKAKEKGLNFEVVLVTSDKNAEKFRAYLKKMPWPAVSYDDAKGEAGYAFNVSALPTLVIVDPEGNVVTTEGRRVIESDPELARFPWAGGAGSSGCCTMM